MTGVRRASHGGNVATDARKYSSSLESAWGGGAEVQEDYVPVDHGLYDDGALDSRA